MRCVRQELLVVSSQWSCLHRQLMWLSRSDRTTERRALRKGLGSVTLEDPCPHLVVKVKTLFQEVDRICDTELLNLHAGPAPHCLERTRNRRAHGTRRPRRGIEPLHRTQKGQKRGPTEDKRHHHHKPHNQPRFELMFSRFFEVFFEVFIVCCF